MNHIIRVRYRVVQPRGVSQPFYQVKKEARQKLLQYLTACEYWIAHPSLWPDRQEVGYILRQPCKETWGADRQGRANRVRDVIPGLTEKLRVGDLTKPQVEILERVSLLINHYCDLFPTIEYTHEL